MHAWFSGAFPCGVHMLVRSSDLSLSLAKLAALKPPRSDAMASRLSRRVAALMPCAVSAIKEEPQATSTRSAAVDHGHGRRGRGSASRGGVDDDVELQQPRAIAIDASWEAAYGVRACTA